MPTWADSPSGGRAADEGIRVDENAAGWGWFVDLTPRNDSEFTRSGNEGEKNRTDLSKVLTREVGHLVGYGHAAGAAMFVWNSDARWIGDLVSPPGTRGNR